MNIGSLPLIILPNAKVDILRDTLDDPSDPQNSKSGLQLIHQGVSAYIGASTGQGPRPRFDNWQSKDFSQSRWYWARFDDASLDLRDEDILTGYTPPDSIPTTEAVMFRMFVRKYTDPIPHLSAYLAQVNL